MFLIFNTKKSKYMPKEKVLLNQDGLTIIKYKINDYIVECFAKDINVYNDFF